ncbi:hypothetical protein JW960_20030 [candidate division KSB1 bacterium]|nr:hypothetical protein [candidate division KSB1 bacterium]
MNDVNSVNAQIDNYEPRFQGFYDLMPYKVREILLVSSLYDSFILEEDGQLGENILADYYDLELSHAPRITRVSTGELALKAVRDRQFDMIITMLRVSDMDVSTFGRRIKSIRPELPVVLLAYESDISSQILGEDSIPGIDRVFIWTGDTKILVAIIKLIEDHQNVQHDTDVGNVRVIVVVENSRRYFSLFLPIIYSEIMKQTQALIAEGLNEMHRQLRRRARPKILLAEKYEDGMNLCKQYSKNLLGVISDIRYFKDGVIDPDAGFKFALEIKENDPELPILLMSSQQSNSQRAYETGASFLDKNSISLLHDLRRFILEQLGFGEFIFKLPNGRKVGRATTMRKMEEMLSKVPDESLLYHASRNHFSNWLMARTEFTLAKKLRPFKITDFSDASELRQHLLKNITDLRESKQRGVIIEFSRQRFDPENAFTRLASGSLGGKARGIAFLRALLERSQIHDRFPGVRIEIPHTVVVGTDVFDQFLDANLLRDEVVRLKDDQEIAARFLAAKLPLKLVNDLKFYLDQIKYPLAIRSSSLLEDSQFQPFAGLYSTYMLPNNSVNIKTRLDQLSAAIKLIFASTFYQSPKAYIDAIGRSIEEEKMAVIIQEMVGQSFGKYFYPSFSGVAQSYNYYPVSYQKPEDGIAQVALGLGKMVVDGGKVLRFSPRHPDILPQFSNPDMILQNSQREFYALDMSNPDFDLTKDEGSTLGICTLDQAEKHGTLNAIGGTFSLNDQRIFDGIYHNGVRVVTFAHVLKYDVFPLANILLELLEIGRYGMGCPIQIEFAVNLSADKNKPSTFNFLQIRPMVSGGEDNQVQLDNVSAHHSVCCSGHALGNGKYKNLYDVIFIGPETFNAAQTKQIAAQIGIFNSGLIKEGRRYLLVGPGRWGTADPWLGIPVTWEQISGAKVIVEYNMEGFAVEPSQGTHFFHNITSSHIGYFSLQCGTGDDRVNFDWLKQQPVVAETEFVRHVRLKHPLEVHIDGRTRTGIIMKNDWQNGGN